MRHITFASMILLAGSFATAATSMESQNFNSAAAASAGGWVGVNNNPIAGTGGAGGTIFWSNTNNTLGNPAGEAGGNISRTDGAPAYYADTTLGAAPGTFNVFSELHASGELYLDNVNGDTQTIIGYFDSLQSAANMLTPDYYIGFRILSGNTIRANAFGGDYGGYNGSGGNAGLPIQANFADGAYTWSFDYYANQFPLGGGQFNYGQITLTITPAGGGASTVLRNALNPAQNRSTRVLRAFGIGAYNSTDSNSFLTNTYFIDGLSYSVVPEPAGLSLCAVGLLGMSRRRR